jgi:cation:H+ antiporter
LGISPTLVGLFLIGPSTSLPELVVNVTAAFKRKAALSLGNILGTIVYASSVALGTGVAIAGFKVDPQLVQVDLPFLVLMTFIVVLFFYTKEKMQRNEGLLLLGLYGVYAGMKFLIGG